MNPLASVAIGRSFFSLTGERPGLGSTGQLPGGSQPLLLQEQLAQKRQRPKWAGSRRNADRLTNNQLESGACVFREIFYFANPGGLASDKRSGNRCNSKSSWWIFQRYNGGNSKRA